MAWLNRAGIILNVIAGLLLGPQLIPEDRVADAEEWAKKRLVAVTERQRKRTAKIRARWASGLPYKRQIAIALIFIAVATVGTVMDGAYNQLWGASSTVVATGLGVAALGVAVMVLVVAVGTMLIAALAAWRLANAVLAWALSIARVQSEASALVKGILTACGIACFVVGYALQFAATFE